MCFLERSTSISASNSLAAISVHASSPPLSNASASLCSAASWSKVVGVKDSCCGADAARSTGSPGTESREVGRRYILAVKSGMECDTHVRMRAANSVVCGPRSAMYARVVGEGGWTHVANVEIGHGARDRGGCSRHDDGGGDGKGFQGVERRIETVLVARRDWCGDGVLDEWWGRERRAGRGPLSGPPSWRGRS